jgi:hypothetical protein
VIIQKVRAMTRGIVKDGVIHPVEPLPSAWVDGTEVTVERSADAPVAPSDHWDELEAMVQDNDPEDDERLTRAIIEIRQQDKELARQELENA